MGSADTDDTSANVLRHLAIVMALAGNEFDGMRNADLCKAVGLPSDKVSRALKTLIAPGWAERLDNGLYRLGKAPVQISVAFGAASARARQRVDETIQRYTAPLAINATH